MPKFSPIALEPDIKAVESDLLEFHCDNTAIKAAYIIPQRPYDALEVSFADEGIVRPVDGRRYPPKTMIPRMKGP